ncbi:hypothetical protein IEQ34_023116 [Dendrobium chrysotoxum]|uniref:WEB family protein n=1 Tax=Dendrobium chrysotoxum TaxID=161865 RepID=A0AAV7FZV4_DENCH|nr:hypothetical protein IEQ34_023116 [Dendrobium chrysotoxum]
MLSSKSNEKHFFGFVLIYSRNAIGVRSGLSDVANNKNILASKIGRPRPAKLDVDSPPSQKNTSFSINGSPNSADSKPVVSRRSAKISTTPDKYSRLLKGSELQVQLSSVQEDLKKAKEQIAFQEIERANVLEELSDAKKAVVEVSEKLGEALLALKKVEESSELEKFHAEELKQAAIEAARKREEKWHKELDDISNQHAVDVSALLSATQELQRVKQVLVMTTDAKNSALKEADETMRIAEINAEKVEILSGEIDRLKSVLESQLESKSNETAQVIKKLGSEAEALKLELSRVKVAEEKLVEMEALVEGLKTELADAKKAESDAVGFVDEWKKKTQLLESCLEEVQQSERLLQDSLASLTKQLRERHSMLNNAESEVFCLKGKIEVLEVEVERHKADLEESDHQLELAKQEVRDVEKTVEVLKSEIGRADEMKAQTLNNERLRSSNLESLTHINNKLEIELGITREDSEKSRKAMEGLASALHEVSMEARDLQERLLIKQAEVESTTGQLDRVQSALKITQETFEVRLDEAKYEIVCLKKSIEKSETEAKNLRAQWDAKEINLRTAIKKADEEIASMKLERHQAMEKLETENFDAKAAVEEANKLHDKIRQAESELIEANNVIEKEKEESKCLKERLLDKENELQRITQENYELRARETASSEKIKELSESLAKVSTKKIEENGDASQNTEYGLNGLLSNNGNEHTIMHKMIVVMDDKVDETETENSEAPSEEAWEMIKDDRKLDENGAEGHPVQIEPKICEDGGETSDNKMLSESTENELKPKIDDGKLDQLNGRFAQNGKTSEIKHQLPQKKKKALLNKFGDLLKKTTSK